jgi:thioesterase DpgC
MDEQSKLGVLRGDVVHHPKYAGRHLFGSGINLTALYHGQIPYLFYMTRDMGLVNKLFRGIAKDTQCDPSEVGGGTTEKLWIAMVEGFAIGGACQLLLVCDHVIAEKGAYMTLPARKEGIIPGLANMRLPRFVGDRIARQAILGERRLDCDSPEGRLICDQVVEPGAIEQALDHTVLHLTGSGVVSAEGNRRMIRAAVEPLDLFRQYMAAYTREQAFCHVSPALVGNLEKYWNAASRKAS